MLVHGTADRGCKLLVVLLLLLVATAISAQAVHFHSPNEIASARHCTLCEVTPGILPILTISILSTPGSVDAVEADELQINLQFPEGSNLSVRPPPSVPN